MKIFAVNFFTKEELRGGGDDISYLVRAADYLSAVELAEALVRSGASSEIEPQAASAYDLGLAYGDSPAGVITWGISGIIPLNEKAADCVIVYSNCEGCWINHNETMERMWGSMKQHLDIDSGKTYLSEADAGGPAS
jgi:hypothetical protein